MPELIYLNGSYVSKTEARISPFDRGFLFGDGLYEVVRVYDNQLHCMEEHVNRFFFGVQGLEMHVPFTKPEFVEIAEEVVRESNLGCGLLYWEVSRGSYGVRTHHYQEHMAEPTVFLSTTKYDLLSHDATKRACSVITHPDIRWLKCCYKTVNLLPNCIARTKANRAGAFEAILYRDHDHVTEGAGSSLFIVRNGELWTHPNGDLILPGVTRGYVLGLADKCGIPYREDRFGLKDLFDADEVFITGTGVEVMPVLSVDGRVVGNGKAGPVASKLLRTYLQEIGQI